MNTKALVGSCHCGKVAINVAPDSVPGIVKCFCRDCQKHLGNYAPWVVCHKSATTISGSVGEYASSPVAVRLYCTQCGASIAKRPVEGEKVLIAAGIFNQPLELDVIKEVFTEAKESWM